MTTRNDINTESFGDVVTEAEQKRAAAVKVADHIASQHPNEVEGLMPRLAGRQLADDPEVRSELIELLNILGLTDKEWS